jgi:magnesium-transporting ATPase (P-type)
MGYSTYTVNPSNLILPAIFPQYHRPATFSIDQQNNPTTMEKPNALSGSGNKPLSRPAHALTCQEVIDEIQANDNAGLSQAEAKEQLQFYGTNDLGEDAGVQPAKILLRQVANAMTLVTSTIATFSHGETADPPVNRCLSWLWP